MNTTDQPLRHTLPRPLAAALPALLAASLTLADNPPQQAAWRHQPVAVFNAVPTSGFGAPLAGVDSSQLSVFAAGLDEFRTRETPASGLGPIFNGDSCVACHRDPLPGGASPRTVLRFGLRSGGLFDPLEALGGSLLQDKAIDPAALETVPASANVRARRQTSPLYGLGLIEAIPDDAILANANRSQARPQRGRPSLVTDPQTGTVHIGRFGWKAQHYSLLQFNADAYRNEMGITNRLFPTENAPNGNTALLAQFDHIADPEDRTDPATGKDAIDVVTDFTRLLASPPSLPFSAAATAGAAVFEQAGCSSCHTPQMQTGPNAIAALDHQSVNLYSDLLLHDMGNSADGIAQGTASGREMKTPPLWGLRASAPYWHDGRAPTVDAAIQAHGGEAQWSRSRYRMLPPEQRAQLLEFLGSI